MPTYIDTHEEFKDLLKKYSNLVVVDFTATWCGPCQQIAPYFDELAEKFTDVIFTKIDVDKNEETSEVCEIVGMPTFQFYKEGKKIDQITGGDKTKLLDFVEKYRK